ncbi:MAG: polyamine aminopropyltransferase [Bacillota bacterium]|nr:polyamine aminopropyltransferase [Bacillota bacterium]
MENWFSENQSEGVKFSIKTKDHIYSGKSNFQKIDIYDTEGFGRVLVIDDCIMCTEKDEFIYHEMITHVPMAVNPEIKNVLIIGGGDGGAVRELIRYKTIGNIDVVEIDELVVKVSRQYLNFTADSFKDERVRIFIDDGVNFVKKSEKKYDLIIIDSTDPIGPGEGLFTLDFYKNCYRLLREDGILINQNESPYYINNAKEMIRAHQKQKSVFNISLLYQYMIPTYGSGYWFFGFSSKKLHPVNDIKEKGWRELNLKTRYYNIDVHKAAFVLPNYVKESLERGEYYFTQK